MYRGDCLLLKRGRPMKRSERLVDFTNYLLNHARKLTTLSFLVTGMVLQSHQYQKI